MTPEQFSALLQDLAHVAGMTDTEALLTQGRLTIGDKAAILLHDPGYDADLVQVRLLLGAVPDESRDTIAQALLEANYVEGYGGECVFSLRPNVGDAVLTMRLRLEAGLSAQEFWQSLSDIARHAGRMWEGVSQQAGVPSANNGANAFAPGGMAALQV